MRVGERFRFGHRRREMQSLLCNLTVAHPSQKTRMMGVGMFVKWDEHMSYRRHRVPPLQRTQGRGTHSRIIGGETKTEGRATRPNAKTESGWLSDRNLVGDWAALLKEGPDVLHSKL